MPVLAASSAGEGVRDGDGVRLHALAERGHALDAAEARPISIGSPSATPNRAAVSGFISTPRSLEHAPAVSWLMIGIDMFSAKFVSAVLNVIAYSG